MKRSLPQWMRFPSIHFFAVIQIQVSKRTTYRHRITTIILFVFRRARSFHKLIKWNQSNCDTVLSSFPRDICQREDWTGVTRDKQTSSNLGFVRKWRVRLWQVWWAVFFQLEPHFEIFFAKVFLCPIVRWGFCPIFSKTFFGNRLRMIPIQPQAPLPSNLS